MKTNASLPHADVFDACIMYSVTMMKSGGLQVYPAMPSIASMASQYYVHCLEELTLIGSSMLVSVTAAILALSVAVGVFRKVLVAVTAFLAGPQFNDLDVFSWRVVAVLAAKLLRARGCSVLLTLTASIALAPLYSLNVLHFCQLHAGDSLP